MKKPFVDFSEVLRAMALQKGQVCLHNDPYVCNGNLGVHPFSIV